MMGMVSEVPTRADLICAGISSGPDKCKDENMKENPLLERATLSISECRRLKWITSDLGFQKSEQ